METVFFSSTLFVVVHVPGKKKTVQTVSLRKIDGRFFRHDRLAIVGLRAAEASGMRGIRGDDFGNSSGYDETDR